MSAIDVSNIPDPEFTELRDAIDAEVYKLGVYQSPILLQSMPGLAVVYSLISSIKQQLTAEREAREKSEKNFAVLEYEVKHWQQRAESAEACIKASQEQEPHHWLLKPSVSNTHVSLSRRELSLNGKFNEHWDIEAAYYAKPIIPPELEELQRENADLKAWKESALAVMPDYQAIGNLLGVKLGDSVHDKIFPAIEELTRKLAEHQAAFVRMGYVGKVDGKEELERMLSEVRNAPEDVLRNNERFLFFCEHYSDWVDDAICEKMDYKISAFIADIDAAMISASTEYKERT